PFQGTPMTDFIPTKSMPSPYPARTEALPWQVSEISADWLTRTLSHRYPGIVAEAMKINQFIDSHTSKLRISVDFNEVGRNAGIPRNLCLKSNWSGDFEDVD